MPNRAFVPFQRRDASHNAIGGPLRHHARASQRCELAGLRLETLLVIKRGWLQFGNRLRQAYCAVNQPHELIRFQRDRSLRA